MKLELISFALCPYVHRSAMLMKEKRVEYELKLVDLADKPNWFLELSPRGKVPLLVADGLVLFESAAINEFIDETHAPRLMPQDPFERAQHRAWIEVASDLFMQQYRMLSSATEEEYVDAKTKCEVIAERLEKVIVLPCFSGEKLTLVDVAFAPALYRFELAEKHAKATFFAATPKFDTWLRQISSRPSVRAATVPDFEKQWREALDAKAGYFTRLLA